MIRSCSVRRLNALRLAFVASNSDYLRRASTLGYSLCRERKVERAEMECYSATERRRMHCEER